MKKIKEKQKENEQYSSIFVVCMTFECETIFIKEIILEERIESRM
jgi:hypothetical protein